MLGKKNVRYAGIFKASKNLLYHTYFKDCASQKFAENIRLKTYFTILTEPDLSLQN